MIKQMAWNTFKNTGNIDTFLELIEVENAQKNVAKLDNIVEANVYGDNKNNRDSNSRA